MRASLLIIGAGLLLAGCSHAPVAGAKDIGGNVFWKLRTLGEGERLATDSDSILMRVRIARLGEEPGTSFSTEAWYAMEQLRSSAVGDWAGRMREGDSATIAIDATRLPWSDLGTERPIGLDSGWVTVELSMRAIRSLADYRTAERALLNARTPADEQRLLSDFLAASTEKWNTFMDVQYILDPKHARGDVVQSGDRVSMHYTASFLDNGQVFDDTHRGQPLTFRLGDPDQVIKGLEIAAHVLPKNGGKGRFIIPSALAFGPAGSSSGIVPPWTPVLYEVEVVGVE